MSREDFLNEVVRIYFRENCSIKKAIDIAKKELNVSATEYMYICEEDK